jgi:spore germination cell wall hydrolase CwlJ-like protein
LDAGILQPANTIRACKRALAILAIGVGSACATAPLEPPSPRIRTLARVVGDVSPAGQARLERSMDPAMLALARRVAPGRRPDLWGRTVGWAALDLRTPPGLGLAALTPDEAVRLNALLPYDAQRATPAPPFFLRSTGEERERALLCLTQAIYYEAALEPTSGQEAVAQIVLNRVRHPAFPKSVCGVVYQGSERVTGCQFTFTCDGSRERAPSPVYWERAKAVAARALAGFVQPQVGTATSYHADYVFPRWGPTLVKIIQIGAHIFYRFPGPAGKPASFTAPYAGGELRVSMAGPSPQALAAARAAALAGQVELGAAPAIDPTAPGAPTDTSPGHVVFGRRVPTKDEIARINASLAAYEARNHAETPAPPAPAPPPITPPPSDKPKGGD